MFVNEILFNRAEFTKYVVTPAIGVSGVGIAMASYGAFDGIVSIDMECKTVVPWAVVRNRK
jgi:hypothetical protein